MKLLKTIKRLNETESLSYDQMKLIAKQQHMHPQVLEWEFIDPKIKKANSK